MAFTASSSSSSSLVNLSSSSTNFFGSGITIHELHSQPVSVQFRPARVSAAATCSSTAARTLPRQHIKSPPSLYEVLGIQTGATCKEIKDAYRRLARVLHPDVSANGQRENTAFEFMKLHEAYETLSDPEKRADYDRMILARRIRPLSYPFEVSGLTNNYSSSSASRFSGYTGRTWETDQCW